MIRQSERAGIGEAAQAPAWYRLPEGWTWSDVARERARWGTPSRFYPLATVPGVVTAWGVPIRKAR